MSNMVVTRIPKTKNYTCLNNEHMFDLRLSGLAQSIMSKILALKDTWEFTMQGLYSMCQEGQKAVQKAFNELVKTGYAVRRQTKDEHTNQWGKMVYYFYESPSLNPNFSVRQETYEQLSFPELQDTPQTAEQAACQKPLSGKAQQLNTKSSSTVIKSVSPVQEQTDEKQDEKFTALQSELAELSAYPFLKEGEFKDFVADMLPRMTEAALQQQNVQEKLLEIGHKECSLFSFLNKLKARCEKALKNLKYPKARDKFLLTTIQNAVQEYEIESPEQETPEKQPVPEKKSFTFNGILRLIGSSLCTLPDSFKSEEELSCFDACDRQVEECRIPKEFAYSSAVSEAEQALRFLFCYSYLDDEENLEYKEFTGTVARCLAEVICTGMKNSVRGADADAVIDRLNQINQYDSGSLVQWLDDFANHYSEKLVEARVAGQKIRNHYAYLKACAVNYLLKDSCSGDPFLYDNIF